MGLVNELQESVERDDVQTVLRKALRLSSKLGRSDIAEWLRHEQDGYPDAVPVPAYRILQVSYWYDTNGYVPAGFGMVAHRVAPLHLETRATCEVAEPISTVATWVEELRKKAYIDIKLQS